MTELDTKAKNVKRGVKRYAKNPFLDSTALTTKTGVRKISNSDGNRMMMVSESTGEIMAPAGFWHAQEVDKTAFVKLFINGVKAFVGLTASGTRVFEILYLRIQESIGKDELWLTYPSIDQEATPMGESTFYRGMKELLMRNFIAESTTPGLYFLNPDYLWNGDKLAFIKEYRLRKDEPKEAKKSNQTFELPFEM